MYIIHSSQILVTFLFFQMMKKKSDFEPIKRKSMVWGLNRWRKKWETLSFEKDMEVRGFYNEGEDEKLGEEEREFKRLTMARRRRNWSGVSDPLFIKVFGEKLSKSKSSNWSFGIQNFESKNIWNKKMVASFLGGRNCDFSFEKWWSNDESSWENAMCHLLICEKVDVEKLNIKSFKYLFFLIFDKKIRL